MKVGRKTLPLRDKYASWLRPMTVRQLRKTLPIALLDQLEACQSDIARRILLGVSEQEAA